MTDAPTGIFIPDQYEKMEKISNWSNGWLKKTFGKKGMTGSIINEKTKFSGTNAWQDSNLQLNSIWNYYSTIELQAKKKTFNFHFQNLVHFLEIISWLLLKKEFNKIIFPIILKISRQTKSIQTFLKKNKKFRNYILGGVVTMMCWILGSTTSVIAEEQTPRMIIAIKSTDKIINSLRFKSAYSAIVSVSIFKVPKHIRLKYQME